MQEFQQVSQEVLLDLLAEHTANYTREYIKRGHSEELERLRKVVLSIQSELRFRRETYDSSRKQDEMQRKRGANNDDANHPAH